MTLSKYTSVPSCLAIAATAGFPFTVVAVDTSSAGPDVVCTSCPNAHSIAAPVPVEIAERGGLRSLADEPGRRLRRRGNRAFDPRQDLVKITRNLDDTFRREPRQRKRNRGNSRRHGGVRNLARVIAEGIALAWNRKREVPRDVFVEGSVRNRKVGGIGRKRKIVPRLGKVLQGRSVGRLRQGRENLGIRDRIVPGIEQVRTIG